MSIASTPQRVVRPLVRQIREGASMRSNPYSSSFPVPSLPRRSLGGQRYRSTSNEARARSSSNTSSSSRSRTKRRPPYRELIWPLLLASAVSSLAINLRNARDKYATLQAEHAAKLSVLHDLLERLEAGGGRRGVVISKDDVRRDFERVGILVREDAKSILSRSSSSSLQASTKRIGWREMIFGRKKTQAELDEEQREMNSIERAFDAVDTADIESLPPGPATTTSVAEQSAVLPASPQTDAVPRKKSSSPQISRTQSTQNSTSTLLI